MRPDKTEAGQPLFVLRIILKMVVGILILKSPDSDHANYKNIDFFDLGYQGHVQVYSCNLLLVIRPIWLCKKP